MAIDTKNRGDLKAYFVKNAIPTESNFADFIDAGLNQADDGVFKLPDDPLSIVAAGGPDSPKKALHIYASSAANADPTWVLSLNPRAAANDPASARPGLAIGDNDGKVALFIDRATGNVGVGVVKAESKLHVAGEVRVDSHVRVGGALLVTGRAELGVATAASDFGAALQSGFYQSNNQDAATDVPDTSHNWSHLITCRHSNKGNNHQLQIAASYAVNNRLFFRKLAKGNTESHNPAWHELVTRDALDIQDNFTATVRCADFRMGHSTRRGDPGRAVVDATTTLNLNHGEDWPNGVLSFGNFRATGDAQVDGVLRAIGGVKFDGNLSEHVESDGALYRYQGQVYLTVDDHLYIRDRVGEIRFHFNTNNGLLVQEGWQAATFQDGWVNYGGGYNPAGYFKDSMGVVHLRGLVKSGAVDTSHTIFTLPAGYRPDNRELLVVMTNSAAGRVDVLKNGRVLPTSVSASWLSLDGLSFRAG